MAERLATESEIPPDAVDSLRRIFDLDSVAAFKSGDGGWEIEQAAGAPVPRQPDEAQFTIELGGGRVLALTGNRLQADDAELMRTLLRTMLQAREREQTAQLASKYGKTYGPLLVTRR